MLLILHVERTVYGPEKQIIAETVEVYARQLTPFLARAVLKMVAGRRVSGRVYDEMGAGYAIYTNSFKRIYK